MLSGPSDRFWDLFDRSRSKIGLILLGFMVMVPLGLLGIESLGDGSDGVRLYPISASPETKRNDQLADLDGASDFGLDGESAEKSPSGPSKRRSGNSDTAVRESDGTLRQSPNSENDSTTLGPERIGPRESTLATSGPSTTAQRSVAPSTTKRRTVTTRRKASTTTRRRSTTLTRRRTTTTKRRATTTVRRRTTTTRKPTTAPRATVVGPQPTLGPPPPTALLDETPSKDIDD